MIWFALYVFASLSIAAGICGHPPVLPRLVRAVAAWRARGQPRGYRVGRHAARRPQEPTGRRPAWARTGEHDHR
ncbi:hypothetical protein SUDANB1_05599 [Streptomyces sp. enrichment culture]|uniref:hypothetical protein n=1 Tax=Streptomyces sp. enrichment culture TaxID=1795815 RepID=UPI003F5728E7